MSVREQVEDVAAETRTCDVEFGLGRLRGDFVSGAALVDTEVRLLDAAHDQNERPRVRRQELDAIARRQLNSVLQPGTGQLTSHHVH